MMLCSRSAHFCASPPPPVSISNAPFGVVITSPLGPVTATSEYLMGSCMRIMLATGSRKKRRGVSVSTSSTVDTDARTPLCSSATSEKCTTHSPSCRCFSTQASCSLLLAPSSSSLAPPAPPPMEVSTRRASASASSASPAASSSSAREGGATEGGSCWRMFSQSTPSKKGCDRSSSCPRGPAPRRWSWSVTRSLRMRSLAASGTWSGKGIISKLTTFWKVRYSVSPLKGGLPTSIWKSTHPRDQKSVLLVSFAPFKVSGATYSAVPTNEPFRFPDPSSLSMPSTSSF
mmetsp:Transcript_29627/g.64666  ORF Transcript_29627/g.64666 Transcript_29627/m.64666 type:complete len:288 (+) Transcript_29627:245-1108(+)